MLVQGIMTSRHSCPQGEMTDRCWTLQRVLSSLTGGSCRWLRWLFCRLAQTSQNPLFTISFLPPLNNGFTFPKCLPCLTGFVCGLMSTPKKTHTHTNRVHLKLVSPFLVSRFVGLPGSFMKNERSAECTTHGREPQPSWTQACSNGTSRY